MTNIDRNSQLTRALTILRLVGDYPRCSAGELAQHLRCRESISLHTRTVRRYLLALQAQQLTSEIFISGKSYGWRAAYKLIPNPEHN